MPEPLSQKMCRLHACDIQDEAAKQDDQTSVRVPLILCGGLQPAGTQPLSFGVPFPRGMLQSPGMVVLKSGSDVELPCQTEVLAYWPDRSVKWLLVDTVLQGAGSSVAELVLQSQSAFVDSAAQSPRQNTGQGAPRSIESANVPPADAGSTDLGRFVDTASGRFRIGCCWQNLLQWERAGGATAATLSVQLTDSRGRRCQARVDSMQVDAAGPIRTTLLLAGKVRRRRGIRFKIRLCFFHQTGLVRARLTMHNSRRARHRGGLWDLGDPGSFLFRELSLEIAFAEGGPVKLEFKVRPSEAAVREPSGRVEIYQDSSGGENWRSRNHVNRDGRIPCRFRGYRVCTPGAEFTGSRASPILAGSRGDRSIAVALPEFWQQFPKRLASDDGRLRVDLFPAEWNDLHELQAGEQKTHIAWFDFTASGAASTQPLAWVHHPTRAAATPQWTAGAQVIPWLVPTTSDSDERLNGFLEETVRGGQSFFAKREVIDEYGWRNYGDVYADHEAAYYTGPLPVISHYNNQFDLLDGFLIQWLRSGDADWYELADPLARHVADIDIYRTEEDRAAYNGGLFWFTDHYLDVATCSHRTYSRANRPTNGSPYGGGPSSEHNFTTGLLHYYFLTGCPEARDAVLQLADWVIAMDDGRKNILGVLDPRPTGLATHRSDTASHGLNRAAGNSISALVDAWELTNQPVYLRFAETLIKRVVHPDDDISAFDLLNAEKHWSYTVFLSSLAKYLRAKEEACRLDDEYQYARCCLLHYAGWMLEHEHPYLDHADKLQYPTEAWAAQEFRKANVLRLAARYADSAHRKNLLARGFQLAERAWSDLSRFESKATARSVAILMTEGVRDLYFRRDCPPAPVIEMMKESWGPKECFATQRARIGQRLRTAGGWAQIAVRLLDARSWRKTRLTF